MSLPALYYAFAIPVGIIILANAIISGMILKSLLCRPKGLQSNQSERKRTMMNLRTAFSVLVLLGKGCCITLILLQIEKLPPIVGRRAHVLFTLFVLVCYSGVQHILCCVFVLFFVVLCCQFLWIVRF